MEYKEVIKKICEEENIKLNIVSNNWIYILEKNNIIKYIVGYTFGLNKDSIAKILDDKYALYSILYKFNIPIIEHNILYKNYNKLLVKELFLKYNKDIVIKANISFGGKDVYHLKSLKELYKVMDKLFIKNYSLSLCPYQDINTEYRIIVLNKDIKLIYKKIKPIVIGDGKSTYQELLERFNPNYFKNKNISHKIIKKGRIKEYNWQFNLSKGAMAKEENNQDVIKELKKIVKMILKVIDINFASIDIALINNEYKVLEINNGVTLTKYMNISFENEKKVYNIYKDAIKELFK